MGRKEGKGKNQKQMGGREEGRAKGRRKKERYYRRRWEGREGEREKVGESREGIRR